MPQQEADVGIFGGSGFYALLDDAGAAAEVAVETPYGPPSAPLTLGRVGGRPVAFLPRHGRNHEHPPHRIPYRANVWAMHSVGVRQLLAPCAAGSLRRDVAPGDFVVVDQLVDRTSGRVQTFHDVGAHHVAFADPYCPVGRAAAVGAARDAGIAVHDGGTMVVVEGPRFSTRAESRWHAAQGWSVVNMTGHPEAVLARELGLCYTSVALVTDYDAGPAGDRDATAVTMDEVLRVFADNNARLRALLDRLVAALPAGDRHCPCAAAANDSGL